MGAGMSTSLVQVGPVIRCEKYMEKEDEYKARNKKLGAAKDTEAVKAWEGKQERRDDRQKSSATTTS